MLNYLVPLVCNYDDCSTKDDSLAEGDIARDGQVIQINDIGNTGKAFGKLVNLQ